jgi:salicylate hydroxylase
LNISAIVIHRADLQRIFYDAAVKAGAQIRFESKVVSVDTSTSRLILEDGSAVMADLVVGADGTSSLYWRDNG